MCSLSEEIETIIPNASRLCDKCGKIKPLKDFRRIDMEFGLEEDDFAFCNECVGIENLNSS